MSIEAIASALPSVRQDAADIAAQTGAPEAFVRDKVGVARRHLLGPGETGIDLAAAAAERLFGSAGVDASRIGLLIYVTQTPDQRLPHNAPGLAERLGLPRGLASFDLSLGCSGFVYGLATAEAFLEAQGIDEGLLVTCDPYSRIMAAEDKATNAVFGDAATATWLRRGRGRTRLVGCDFGTDGSGGQAIRIEAGGAARPHLAFDDPGREIRFERDELRLHMDGRAVFDFVNRTVPASIAASIDKAGLSMDRIDHFALHQGSAHMLRTVARRCGIPEDKLLMNISEHGNTVSSTVPMLLEALMAERDLSGRRVLVSGFGVGLSWATGILEFH